MAYRSLILGMVISIGIFAAKGGMGMAFGTRGSGIRSKTLGMSGFALTYGLVFLAAALVLTNLDMAAHLSAIQNLLRSGMMIHGLMAVLMSAWGIWLLKKRNVPEKRSRGWLLLVVPCPVCAASILFSAAFFLSLFPANPLWSMTCLYLVFLVISIIAMVITGIFMTKAHRNSVQSPESLLGGTMLLIAAYFLVSVTVMPHAGDLSSVYRLAGYRSTVAPPDVTACLMTGLLIAAAFGWGWIMHLKTRRQS